MKEENCSESKSGHIAWIAFVVAAIFFLILYSFSSSCCVLLETLYTFCYDLFKYFFLWVKTLLTDGQETKRVSFSHGSFRPNDNNGITFYLVSFSSLLFFFFLRRVICFVSFFLCCFKCFSSCHCVPSHVCNI